MSPLPEPFAILLPDDWTPEQAWAVHDCLDELLVQIEDRYGAAMHRWIYGEGPEPPPDIATQQLDLFYDDFDDPLSF